MAIRDIEAVERLRSATLWGTALSILVAALLFAWSGVGVSTDGALFASATLLFLLGGAAIFRRRSADSPVGDSFGAMGLIWLAGFASGAVSQLVLRWQLPQADAALLAADAAVGIDALALTAWFAEQPTILAILRQAYGLSFPLLFLSVMIAGLVGARHAVWSTALQFVATLLTACLVSGLVPAKGAFIAASDALLARLPPGSGVYAFDGFELFYRGEPESLGISSIEGVVCFPSFHTAIALITAGLWWRWRWLRPAAVVWAALVIVSTVPIGGHYVVDLAGGALLWFAWHRLADQIAHGARLTRPGKARHPRAYA